MSRRKTDSSQVNSLSQALEIVAEFIRLISASIEEFSWRTDPAIFFSSKDEGTLFLDDEEAKQYRKCLHLLIDAVASEKISTKTIEQLFQKAILKTLDIRENRPEQSFETRLNIALQNLRLELEARPYPFQVYYPVEGMTQDGLPLVYGNVSFCVLGLEQANTLIQELDFEQSPAKERRQFISIVREMIQGLVDKPIGIVTVQATESEAARLLALKELRLTLDVINFFSDLVPFSNGGFCFLPGDQFRTVITTLVTSKKDKTDYTIGRQVVGPLTLLLPAEGLSDAEQKRMRGFLRAGQLLIERKGEFQERLLSAIQWAGRATADSRKEEAFLLYAIALESLILADNKKDELLYRLRTRVAHFLGKNVQSRKELSRQVRDLYGIRSQIVHSGKYQVTDADFGLMRGITKTCIMRALTDEPFLSFQVTTDFSEWFNDRILSHETDIEV